MKKTTLCDKCGGPIEKAQVEFFGHFLDGSFEGEHSSLVWIRLCSPCVRRLEDWLWTIPSQTAIEEPTP